MSSILNYDKPLQQKIALIKNYNFIFPILISSAYETVVPAEGKAVVKTDIAIAIPPDCYGRIGK